MTIQRDIYIDWLNGFKDHHLIKIVTGVRRCGKSTIFALFQQELRHSGIGRKQIQSFNMEDPDHKELLNWEALYSHINAKLVPDKKNYIFLDEIQSVIDFQRAADGLFIKKNVDLYLTGSNSRMLSGEWATMLSGRYVELKMLPLSFKEYVSAYPFDGKNDDQKFEDYINNSSFPQATEFYTKPLGDHRSTQMIWNRQLIHDYLLGLYNGIIIKDVMDRQGVKDPSKLDRVVKFLFSNIGSETSLYNIASKINAEAHDKQQQVKLHSQTVEKYIDGLLDSFVFYRAERSYIKGKAYLESNAKYYAVDVGFRYMLLGGKGADRGHILENIVYLELLRRGYSVGIGRVDAKEVDFVAMSPNGVTEYYQVAHTLRDEKVMQRELPVLASINNHNPKFILTSDYDNTTFNGLRHINIINWLLGKE